MRNNNNTHTKYTKQINASPSKELNAAKKKSKFMTATTTANGTEDEEVDGKKYGISKKNSTRMAWANITIKIV